MDNDRRIDYLHLWLGWVILQNVQCKASLEDRFNTRDIKDPDKGEKGTSGQIEIRFGSGGSPLNDRGEKHVKL